jgi:hypothetical protein
MHKQFFNRLLFGAFNPSKNMDECVYVLSYWRHFSLIISPFKAPRTSAAAQEMIVPAFRMFFVMSSGLPTKDFYWLVDLSVSLLQSRWWNSAISTGCLSH